MVNHMNTWVFTIAEFNCAFLSSITLCAAAIISLIWTDKDQYHKFTRLHSNICTAINEICNTLFAKYLEISAELTLSAVSWPGLGFPGSGIKALSSPSSSFFAFFGSFSSKAFVYNNTSHYVFNITKYSCTHIIPYRWKLRIQSPWITTCQTNIIPNIIP